MNHPYLYFALGLNIEYNVYSEHMNRFIVMMNNMEGFHKYSLKTRSFIKITCVNMRLE